MNNPNKRPENHKIVTKLFSRGIENKTSNIIIGALSKDKYINSRNARVSSLAESKSIERINGEELKYTYVEENGDKYHCAGSEVINKHVISFWASEEWREDDKTPGVIVIDDEIVAESVNFPIRHIYPLDIAKNESCLGGEIYITDNNIPPMCFNIKDLIESKSSGSTKYFEDFDYLNYTINLKSPNNVMVFKGLRVVGGNNGAPVGQYSYSHRFVSNDGDRTNWSISTPLVIVPRSLVNQENPSQLFKYASTRGGQADNQSNTRYAPVLHLRIDNSQNYDYVEIKRTEYNNGEGIGYMPQSYIIQRIQIFENQFSVLEIIDSAEAQTDRIPVASDDETNAISVINKAEAIKYFKNKLILGNIEYEGRDNSEIELSLVQKNGETHTPMMAYLGEKGFRDPVYACYNKSNLNGEVYDYAVILWDDTFQRTFVYTFDELKNFKYPDKRKAVMPDYPNAKNSTDYYNTILHDYGYKNDEFQVDHFKLQSQDTNANNNLNDATETFEVVLHTSYAKAKRENTPEQKNEMVYAPRLYREPTNLIANITQDSFDPPSWNSINPASYGYQKRTPSSDNDLDDKGRSYGANSHVFDGNAWIPYNPDGFNPHYNSLGLAIFGIEGFPDWCSAFSIVRTKPANRVIAQGLGVYSMIELGAAQIFYNDSTFNPNSPTAAGHVFRHIAEIGISVNHPSQPPRNEPSTQLLGSKYFALRQIKKDIFRIHCSFPDMESGLVPRDVLDDIIKNPSSYKLQIVEPLGYFSEVFNGATTYAHDGDIEDGEFPLVKIPIDQKIDMVTYARCQDELLMPESMVGLHGRYSRFGGQRQDGTVTGLFYAGAPGGYITDIESVSINTDNEDGVWFLDIKTSDAIWLKKEFEPVDNTIGNSATGLYQRHWNEDQVKNFQECLYIVNIISPGAAVPSSSTKEYLSPLNYVKLRSKIGTSNGSETQRFEIVDERPEDFYTHAESGLNGEKKKFVYIKKTSTGEELRFINITNLTPLEILNVDSDIEIGTTTFCGLRIHGKYKATKDYVEISEEYSYAPFGEDYYKLKAGDEIYVKYDKNQQITVFGGEIMHNDAVFTYKNRRSAVEGVSNQWGHPEGDVYNIKREHFGSQFALGVGFPFSAYRMHSSVYKHHYYDGRGRVQEERDIALSFIRQWLFVYTCQARTNLSYIYGDNFPNISYVERPNIWNKNKSIVENKVFKQYEDDYPFENERWMMGGFRINYFNGGVFNYDFSRESIHDKQFSRQNFLAEDNKKFCTRIAWSQTRPISSYGSPNLRTFRPFNYYDLSDKYGDIRKLHISTDTKGDNLYAFCENDIALVLVLKQTISGASGETLTTTSTSNANFIGQDIPLNVTKAKGLQKLHKWSFTDNGSDAYYFNENGVFRFKGGSLQEITGDNAERLREVVINRFGRVRLIGKSESVLLECKGSSYYDYKHKEYAYRPTNALLDISKYAGYEDDEDNLDTIDISDSNEVLFDISDIIKTEGVFSESETLSVKIFNTNKEAVFFIRKNLPNNLKIKASGLVSTDFTIEGAGVYSVSVKSTTVEDVTEYEYEISEVSKEMLAKYTKYFVYCDENSVESWTSEYDYIFDKVVSTEHGIFGMRDMKMFQLDKGNLINDENIEFEVLDVINDKEVFDFEKEHMAIQLNTNQIIKSDLEVDFFKESEEINHRTLLGENMKKYAGLWAYVPRDENGLRHQGNFIMYKVKYNGVQKIVLQSVNIQYKLLK